MKKQYLLLLFIICSILSGYSQQSISATGNDISTNELSMSYTLGQIDFKSTVSDDIIINQGVQQAYEIYTTNISDVLKEKFVSVFPNPTLNNITIINNTNKELMCILLDLNGKIIDTIKVTTSQSSIDLDDLAKSIYFLKVYSSFQEKQIIKITKI